MSIWNIQIANLCGNGKQYCYYPEWALARSIASTLQAPKDEPWYAPLREHHSMHLLNHSMHHSMMHHGIDHIMYQLLTIACTVACTIVCTIARTNACTIACTIARTIACTKTYTIAYTVGTLLSKVIRLGLSTEKWPTAPVRQERLC